MTPKNKQDLEKKLKAVKATQARIANLRDQLRVQLAELEEVLNSLDESYEQIEYGIERIEDGLVTASNYL
jgi:peptidoglycan hydrolase CwlO-like protein